MIDAMSYWVRDVGVDGFRCDTAEFIPLDFWCDARDAMRKIKPVFMLAEGNKPELLNYAFDAAYAWNLSPNLEGIAKSVVNGGTNGGTNGGADAKTPEDLHNYLVADNALMPPHKFRLNFTSNHDKNAWEGTTREQLGDAVQPMSVLVFTIPGMPLIFNGQETDHEHRLNFFDHDTIAWQDNPMATLLQKLAQLKQAPSRAVGGYGHGSDDVPRGKPGGIDGADVRAGWTIKTTWW